jgi:hypothetical protein
MNTNNHSNEHSVRTDVMDAIRKGRIQMRPRWHFVLLSALTIVGVFIVFLTLLYVTSLTVFFLRDSGVWFAPAFGLRGWWVLLRRIPWLLVLFIAAFIAVLEILVRRYAFVYRKPLLASVLVILALVFLGGFAIEQTPFHPELDLSARRGQLPPPFGMVYRGPLRMPRPDDSYHGEIVNLTQNGFVIFDEDDAGTTTVVVTPGTRFPYGADFSPGQRVIVVGDRIATGTVQAFGISEIRQ